MLETIVKQQILIYLMGTLLGVSLLAKMISIFTARKLVKAAGELHNSNHRLMKLIKAKFEHASLVSDRVQNVEAFVNKFVYEYKVFGIRLYTWRTVSKKMIWCIGMAGVLAIIGSYRVVGWSGLTVLHVQWTGLLFLASIMLIFVLDEHTNLEITKNYIVEYLENVCVHRYARRNQESEKVEEQMEPINPVSIAIVEEEQSEKEEYLSATQFEEEKDKKNEQEMRIRAILEEFLA